MSIVPYFKYLPTLPVLFSTALVVHWNYVYTFVQEGAEFKVCDVHSVDFVISNLLVLNSVNTSFDEGK